MAERPKQSYGPKRPKKKTMERRFSADSRTPPLPTSLCGIEDLIKRRNYLKKKIQHIANNPKGNQYRKQKLSIEDTKQKHIFKNTEKPPFEHDRHSTSDSENEETIINLRRQLRQKIVEKFNKPISQNNKDIVVAKPQNDSSKIINKDVNVVPARRTRQHEVVDMFSELNEFTYINPKRSRMEEDKVSNNVHDDNGYYCVRIGDTLKDGRYIISGLLGQGVFANVVHVHDKHAKNIKVAIKIIRKKELFIKNSLREISFLKQINNADPSDKYHCIRFLGEFTEKGHLCIILELLHMNLRSYIKTFNKSGLNMSELKNYISQLLSALQLLNKLRIIHADIKPDNILIDQSRKLLKLCDFGSATHTFDTRSPYLVSRYYRAPEIILGAPYDHGVDIWSLACTIYEMATGNILFTGSNNNKMLKAFIDLKGKFPVRVIQRGIFKTQHFNQYNEFLLREVDDVTGKDISKVIRNEKPTRDLLANLKRHCKNEIFDKNAKKLLQLKDLLDKMTLLDPILRISAFDAQKHPFIGKNNLHR